MRRRSFLGAGAAGLAAQAAAAAPAKGAIIELRFYWMRNSADQQMRRMSQLIEKAAMPAARRAGIGPVGAFSSVVAPKGPFLLLLASYPSLAAMEAAEEKLAADKEFSEAMQDFYAQPGLGYERIDSVLLRAFDGMPAVEVPPVAEGKPARLFELRTYESNNGGTLRRKVEMFENGEIAVFRKVGMLPVFFGTAIAGANMPNLAYMLAYDNVAHRDKVWQDFGRDPDWVKLRATPGLSDAEIVSNISNMLLRPLAFSPIR